MSSTDHLRPWHPRTRLGLWLVLTVLVALWAGTAVSATYTVTNTSDSGAGSLRQAIIDANMNLGADDILFHIGAAGSGPHTISPLTDYPTINGPTSIDGWTQGGAGYTGVPLIEIEGSSSSGGNNNYGIDVRAPNCLVRGLVLNRWNTCIWVYNDAAAGASGRICTIQRNYIGLDVTGTIVHSSGSYGVWLHNSDRNLIGGNAAIYRNIITGHSEGIYITGEDGSFNTIQNNFIGTDVTGMSVPGLYGGNGLDNIRIDGGSNNLIGGNGTAGEFNLISGAGGAGVHITGATATGNRVQGNVIGADFAGTGDLGNFRAGVQFDNGASHGIIGGIGPGQLNIIAFNGWHSIGLGGVIIDDTCHSIAISSNRIHHNYYNGGLGIDLGNDDVTANDPGDSDTGANNLQNFPVLASFATAGGTTYISGTLNSLPSQLFALEFFSNQTPHFSGYGEGQTFLGLSTVTTNASGNVAFTKSFATTVPDNYCITATATAIDSSTSEFSHAVYYVAPVLSGSRIGTQHVLAWDDVPGAAAYWVFGKANDAYFDPDMVGFTNRRAVVAAPTLTWSTATGVGDIANNWTYVVVAVTGGGLELARTNYSGEHDFDLP
ncbi:MAG: hypothetical protein MUE60_10165 [Candidatus Eisenbacteria bacterium]|nr:hypothetical protein [Candidatus Eisenbacteria bacterium]